MAKNSPPHDGAHDYDPEVDTDGEDDPAVIDKAVITPLSNPPESHRLSTNLYDSIKALESDLHEYAAQAGFCIIQKRSSNPIPDFRPTYISYACQRGAIRKSRGHGVRATQTTKINCPWEATTKALKANDRR